MASAVSRSRMRLTATMPPKIDTGSEARAFLKASTSSGAMATPHGFMCLIATAAGTRNSFTSSSAALASTRLLNDSSFPCSWRALVTDGSSIGVASR